MADVVAAVEALRVAAVSAVPLSASRLHITAPRAAAAGAIVVDADNLLADVDARLSLAAIGHRLASLGYAIPFFRPWPTVPLWRLAMTMPYVVDALAQRATLLTVDGDAADTPAAPRHAAGPSLLHSVCGPQPLALLKRVHLRVSRRDDGVVGVIDADSAAAAAVVVRDVVAAGRVVAVDAIAAVAGIRVAVFGSEGAVSAAGARVVDAADAAALRPWINAGARVRRSRSLSPGDATAIAAALRAGQRVSAMPAMQRLAALSSSSSSPTSAPAVVGVDAACRAIADALIISRPHLTAEAS